MSIARVVELTATSRESFEDALQQGVSRATKTLRNVRSAWVKEQEVTIENDSIVAFKVNILVTFVLDDAGEDSDDEPIARDRRPAKAPGTPAKGRRR